MKIIALISTRKGLFSLDSNLKIELVDFLGVPVSYTLASANQQHWYTTLDHGHFGVKLHRSSDQGSTWEEITCPAYPSSEEDSEDKGDSLSLIWSMAYGDTSSDKGEKVWAGTIPGGLFYSEDAGNSWQLNQPLWQKKQELEWFGGGFDQAGIHSICVDPRDTNEIKVAISCAGVWVTKDGGESWKNQSQGMRAAYMPPEKMMDVNIQDPHMMVQCPSAPDSLWVQHHNGIFKSTDNSESWQEIVDVSPSVFGFATAVHPEDPNKVWFVPGVKDECRVAVDWKVSRYPLERWR